MLSAGHSTEAGQIAAARRLFAIIAETVDLDLSVRLWDGSRIPLGQNVRSPYGIVVGNAAVLSSLIRRPTRDNLLLHYANGALSIEGGDPRGFILAAESGRGFKRIRRFPRWRILRAAFGVARTSPQHARRSAAFQGEDRDEQFIQFHYDIGNEFYALFLGHEMQYSCGFFEKPNVDLDCAQAAKLDRICRSLQLARGERLLDVGCGWGGLICHAAKHYGVEAHGLTLSAAQYEYAQAKIDRMGLASRVTVELGDYSAFKLPAGGAYDKIASIEMTEHVGLDQFPSYLRKMRSLLRDHGLMLNQATTRRAKRTPKRSRRLGAGSRFIERYVFPGFELNNVGHTVAAMEAARFEVRQVEGWRDHYTKTTELWCRRLWIRRKEAEDLVGEEKTRLWLAYLAGVSVAFAAGSLRVYQIVAAKQGAREHSRAATARGQTQTD